MKKIIVRGVLGGKGAINNINVSLKENTCLRINATYELILGLVVDLDSSDTECASATVGYFR